MLVDKMFYLHTRNGEGKQTGMFRVKQDRILLEVSCFFHHQSNSSFSTLCRHLTAVNVLYDMRIQNLNQI